MVFRDFFLARIVFIIFLTSGQILHFPAAEIQGPSLMRRLSGSSFKQRASALDDFPAATLLHLTWAGPIFPPPDKQSDGVRAAQVDLTCLR